jgi:hypothetical protein
LHFRVAGYVVGENVGLQFPVCDRNLDLSLRMWKLLGGGSGVLSCELFFPFFQWLVASLFVYLERALLVSGYGPLLMPFEVL